MASVLVLLETFIREGAATLVFSLCNSPFAAEGGQLAHDDLDLYGRAGGNLSLIHILCVLYDTAARVSEICNLRIEDVRFESPPHIRIMGKGMKVRAVPILPATAKNEKNPQAMGNWLRGN